MGYSTRNGGQIKDFWPDDNETTIYVQSDKTFNQLIDMIKNKWGSDLSFDDVTISSEHIHTECLSYDSYVSSDHTDFTVISLSK
jgi:hypothetical protein